MFFFRRRKTRKQVRVALFTDTFDEINGVSNTYHRLLDYAVAHRRRLDLYCFGERESFERIRTCRIFRFKRIVAVRYYETLAFELTPHFPLISHLQKAYFDVAHVAAPDSMGLHAVAHAKMRNLPIVGVYHTKIPEYAADLVREPHFAAAVQQTMWTFVRGFYENCALVYATTPAMQEKLIADGLRVPTDVLGRGIDAQLFNPDKRTIVDTGLPTVLYVGRLSHEKNLAWLAHLLNQNRAHLPPFHLCLVGDGPMRLELEVLLPWATFTGFLQGDELARTYANADIFVFPSLTDTFGNVVQEAMASGVPAIVCDPKGPGEIVLHGENGFIAPDAESFIGYLRNLLISPDERRRVGMAARLVAQDKDWSREFDKLWGKYEELAWQNGR